MAQQPVENYGVVGDMHTVALVGKDGSIDFMCFPRFDSPTLFAALLDPENGGRFLLAPESADAHQVQLYLPDSAILLTRFLFAEGVAEVSDFMPLACPVRTLVRRVKTVRGEVAFRMVCAPRFDYGRAGHRVERRSEREWMFASEGPDRVAFLLRSDVPLSLVDGDAVAAFRLGAGQSASFVLEEATPGRPAVSAAPDFVSASFKRTNDAWRRTMARSAYRGRWREIVHRSALTLMLLSSERYGSMVASPTFGLPERPGGDRNWDYRYTWIRDTSFALYAFLRLGFTHAHKFMEWVEARCGELRPDGALQVMYGIDGRHDLPEETLPHWSGYGHSQPVRIGNAAHDQLQLDIYGELMDAVYLYKSSPSPSRTTCGGTSCGSSSSCAPTGARRTRASGRCAVAARSSSCPGSCAGWRWVAPSGSRRSARSPRRSRSGTRSATRSTRTCSSASGPPRGAPSCSTGPRRRPTPRRCSCPS
jgi:GH15 family glucan-1,4-alpha-glucosidase